jgi:hypothetical protein
VYSEGYVEYAVSSDNYWDDPYNLLNEEGLIIVISGPWGAIGGYGGILGGQIFVNRVGMGVIFSIGPSLGIGGILGQASQTIYRNSSLGWNWLIEAQLEGGIQEDELVKWE